MFAGHLGAALLLKRANRAVSLAALFLGALLLDIVLWLLVLAGVESVEVPPDLRTMADLRFDFPYSHSLVASLGWSGAAFAAGWLVWRRSSGPPGNGALILAAAVLSHFILDWLVHVPELPVAGRSSRLVGLGLWKHLPLAWTVEASLALSGLWIYLRTELLPRSRALALTAVVLGVTGMTILGQASTSPPPPPAVMASTSLVTIALLVWFAWWMERGGTKLRR